MATVGAMMQVITEGVGGHSGEVSELALDCSSGLEMTEQKSFEGQ
jgi:hypothetical protein